MRIDIIVLWIVTIVILLSTIYYHDTQIDSFTDYDEKINSNVKYINSLTLQLNKYNSRIDILEKKQKKIDTMISDAQAKAKKVKDKSNKINKS